MNEQNWNSIGPPYPGNISWLFRQSHIIIYDSKNPFSHLTGLKTKECFAAPLHIVETKKNKMNETLWSHGPQKQAYTHAHRHVSHDNESSLNTLQNSCLTMGYVQLSSLTPVWECVCVRLWVRDPTTHGSRHHNGTQISTSQAIIISCQATRKTHIERPVLARWPYKLISIIQI